MVVAEKTLILAIVGAYSLIVVLVFIDKFLLAIVITIILSIFLFIIHTLEREE